MDFCDCVVLCIDAHPDNVLTIGPNGNLFIRSDSLVDNGDGTVTHTAVDGTVVTFSFDQTSDSLVDNLDGTFTHTAVDGTVVIFRVGSLTTYNNESTSVFDPDAPPAAPINPPANALILDTLQERYGNYLVNWTYDGGAWVMDFATPICCTLYDSKGCETYCPSMTIGEIVNTPEGASATPAASEWHVELFTNGMAVYGWSGTAWYRQTYINDATIGDASAVPTPGAAPLNPPPAPAPFEQYYEIYGDGIALWVNVFGVWNLQASGFPATIRDTGEAFGDCTDPTEPDNPPATPLEGTVLVETWGDVEFVFSFVGGTWQLMSRKGFPTRTFLLIGSGINFSDAADFTQLAPGSPIPIPVPDSPEIAPQNPACGDIVEIEYQGSTVIYKYSEAGWSQVRCTSGAARLRASRLRLNGSFTEVEVNAGTRQADGQIVYTNETCASVVLEYMSQAFHLAGEHTGVNPIHMEIGLTGDIIGLSHYDIVSNNNFGAIDHSNTNPRFHGTRLIGPGDTATVDVFMELQANPNIVTANYQWFQDFWINVYPVNNL